MGYHSTVRCVIYGPKETFEAFLTDQIYISSSTVFQSFRGALSQYDWLVHCDQDEQPTPFRILDLQTSGKWYDDNTDVTAWNEFLTAAVEAGLEYELIRIGEDPTDIEKLESDNVMNLIFVGEPPILEDFPVEEPIPLPV